MGKPGLTWPLRAASFTPSALPRDCVFSARGYVIQAEREDLPWILGLTSSSIFDYLFKVCLGRTGFPEFIVGILQQLPVPNLSAEARAAFASKANEAWSARRLLDGESELSHAFTVPDRFT